jgi:hypothetical protein
MAQYAQPMGLVGCTTATWIRRVIAPLTSRRQLNWLEFRDLNRPPGESVGL